MKTPTSILLAAAIVGMAGCSTVKTSADYDRSTDFTRYRTFAFKDVRPMRNEIMERRIKSAVESVLAAKGLRRTDENPDLWVVPHVRLSEDIEIHTYDRGWGYGWRWGRRAGPTVSTVERVPVGTLIVDLVDAKQNELVWRGTASDTLKPNATPAEKERALSEAVSKMFGSFPPPPA